MKQKYPINECLLLHTKFPTLASREASLTISPCLLHNSLMQGPGETTCSNHLWIDTLKEGIQTVLYMLTAAQRNNRRNDKQVDHRVHNRKEKVRLWESIDIVCYAEHSRTASGVQISSVIYRSGTEVRSRPFCDCHLHSKRYHIHAQWQ